jgi:hypothetical protein
VNLDSDLQSLFNNSYYVTRTGITYHDEAIHANVDRILATAETFAESNSSSYSVAAVAFYYQCQFSIPDPTDNNPVVLYPESFNQGVTNDIPTEIAEMETACNDYMLNLPTNTCYSAAQSFVCYGVYYTNDDVSVARVAVVPPGGPCTEANGADSVLPVIGVSPTESPAPSPTESPTPSPTESPAPSPTGYSPAPSPTDS